MDTAGARTHVAVELRWKQLDMSCPNHANHAPVLQRATHTCRNAASGRLGDGTAQFESVCAGVAHTCGMVAGTSTAACFGGWPHVACLFLDGSQDLNAPCWTVAQCAALLLNQHWSITTSLFGARNVRRRGRLVPTWQRLHRQQHQACRVLGWHPLPGLWLPGGGMRRPAHLWTALGWAGCVLWQQRPRAVRHVCQPHQGTHGDRRRGGVQEHHGRRPAHVRRASI